MLNQEIMMIDRKKHIRFHRRSIRLHGYDYSKPGLYFVTICTHQGRPLLGEIKDSKLTCSAPGKIVEQMWFELAIHYKTVQLDSFVVMPNHVHGVVILESNTISRGAIHCALKYAPIKGAIHSISPKIAPELGVMNHAPTLGSIVRWFKARSTRIIRSTIDDSFGWQRNYYERIIRDDDELGRIRQYICNNPLHWLDDEENPDRF